MIVDAWKTATPEVKAYCSLIAGNELTRYREEQKAFKERYGRAAWNEQVRKKREKRKNPSVHGKVGKKLRYDDAVDAHLGHDELKQDDVAAAAIKDDELTAQEQEQQQAPQNLSRSMETRSIDGLTGVFGAGAPKHILLAERIQNIREEQERLGKVEKIHDPSKGLMFDDNKSNGLKLDEEAAAVKEDELTGRKEEWQQAFECISNCMKTKRIEDRLGSTQLHREPVSLGIPGAQEDMTAYNMMRSNKEKEEQLLQAMFVQELQRRGIQEFKSSEDENKSHLLHCVDQSAPPRNDDELTSQKVGQRSFAGRSDTKNVDDGLTNTHLDRHQEHVMAEIFQSTKEKLRLARAMCTQQHWGGLGSTQLDQQSNLDGISKAQQNLKAEIIGSIKEKEEKLACSNNKGRSHVQDPYRAHEIEIGLANIVYRENQILQRTAHLNESIAVLKQRMMLLQQQAYQRRQSADTSTEVAEQLKTIRDGQDYPLLQCRTPNQQQDHKKHKIQPTAPIGLSKEVTEELLRIRDAKIAEAKATFLRLKEIKEKQAAAAGATMHQSWTSRTQK
eukprot:scaffold18946_cov57-Cyclotella_meneghiniana.AAC.2